jgi:hypothetical protein
MTHRERVDRLVAAYARTQPDLGADTAAEDFARFAATRGAPVRVVHASDGEDPAHPSRTWVRVLNVEGIHGYDVDVSGGPEVPDALVWRMDGAHPAGVYRTLRVVPAVPAAR